MIQNFYTYLFFSAMFCGAMMANIVKIVCNSGRKVKFDALLHVLLIQALSALIILLVGILLSNVLLESLRSYCVFYVLSFAVLFVLFLFLRNLTLLLTGIVLLILAISCQISLKGFESVTVGFFIDFTVLRSDDYEQTIEVVVSGQDYELLNIEKNNIYPCIVEVRLSPYLFFMPSVTYVSFYGFIESPDQLDMTKIGTISIPEFLYTTRLLPAEPLSSEPLKGRFYRYAEEGWEVSEKKQNISKITG